MVYVLQATVGLLALIWVVAYPIYKGSRVTVQRALGDSGVGQGSFGKAPSTRFWGASAVWRDRFLLSLRNTFRWRGRLALALGTLAAGGAVFIVAMNVAALMNYSVAKRFDAARG